MVSNTVEFQRTDQTRRARQVDSPRRIAVTGGSGDFGTKVIRLLLKDPKIELVRCLDLAPPRLSDTRLEFAEVDVRDEAALEQSFADIDTVVHLAFLISRYRPKELFDAINIEGSKNVCRAAQQCGVRQIVYASSSAVYGLVRTHPVPIVESTPRVHQPDFSYNDAKWRVEDFMDRFEQQHPQLILTRLRFVSALGPGQTSAISSLLAKGWIPSTSDVPWSIVWEDDVADAVVLALEQRAPGPFNLSTEEPMSGGQLAKASGLRSLRIPRWLGIACAHVSSLTGKLGIGTAVDPAWFKYSNAILILSSERARRELGWQPRCETALEVIAKVRDLMAAAKNV